MYLRACDRTAPKREIRDWLLALAAEADQPLSRAKADKLADSFKRGKFDPDLAIILTYRDPTGEAAVGSRRWEPSRHIGDRRPGEPIADVRAA